MSEKHKTRKTKCLFLVLLFSALLWTALKFSPDGRNDSVNTSAYNRSQDSIDLIDQFTASAQAETAKESLQQKIDEKNTAPKTATSSSLMPLTPFKRTYRCHIEQILDEAASKASKKKIYRPKQYQLDWEPVSDELYAQRFLPPKYKGRTWMLTIKNDRRLFVAMNAKGYPMLLGEDEYNHRIATRYEMPLPMLPAVNWELGTTQKVLQGDTHMRAISLGKGKNRDSGTVKYKVSWVKKGIYQHNGKQYDAIEVTMTRHLDLKFANSDVVVKSVYCKELGLVEQRLNTKTKIMGLIGQSQNEHFSWHK